MNKELKSCPFCGGGFRINSSGAYEHVSDDYCILRGMEICNEKELEEWNKRKPMDEIVFKLTNTKIGYMRDRNDIKVSAFEEAIEIVKGGAK